MKRNVVIVLLFVLFGFFQAQAQRAKYKPQSHELSLQLGSVDAVFPFLGRGDYQGSLPFSAQAVNGFRYTYHYSLTDGFRLNYYNRKANLQEEGTDLVATRVERQLQLGYERKYHNGPHQISFGPELFFNYGETQNLEAPNGPINAFNFQSLGAAFALGYSYFINTKLSMGIEGNLYYQRPNYTSGVTNQNELPAYAFQQNIGGITAGIWLNYHFVKMKKRCTCPKKR
ncbi:MAG: hypothetical protein MRZ79_07450 [Bacteroidia bacterium]|nr:hypothetical protein [Bacteroidia bacterium]